MTACPKEHSKSNCMMPVKQLLKYSYYKKEPLPLSAEGYFDHSFLTLEKSAHGDGTLPKILTLMSQIILLSIKSTTNSIYHRHISLCHHFFHVLAFPSLLLFLSLPPKQLRPMLAKKQQTLLRTFLVNRYYFMMICQLWFIFVFVLV